MDEDHTSDGTDRVLAVLSMEDTPLSHTELARILDIEPSEAGRLASDLVIENRATVTSNRKYRSLDAERESSGNTCV